MEAFSAVSETALMTLKARAVESEKKEPVIQDKVAQECIDRLESILPIELRERILDKELHPAFTRYIALRARKYDGYTKQFLGKYADGLVISLGCGFDTRYWRISKEPWKYIEIDLPNVIEAKRKALGNITTYKMIGCSVLQEDWIEQILSTQREHILFLAEGLFMYLPRDGVISLFKRLAKSFTRSEIVFETVNDRYTRGLWKKMVASKLSTMGTQAGSSYTFGIGSRKDVESFADNIKVGEEWSYFEDEDVKPKIFKLFRKVKFISRTQWTIMARIN